MEEYEQLNDRQKEQADDTAELATEFGMFSQGSGADGAHYFAKNPFASEGIKCGNCVFFNEVTNQCQVVEGSIDSEAVCKLWVIPEASIKSKDTRKAELKALLSDNSSNGKAARQAKIDALMSEMSGD
jgi:hypothetical protein